MPRTCSPTLHSCWGVKDVPDMTHFRLRLLQISYDGCLVDDMTPGARSGRSTAVKDGKQRLKRWDSRLPPILNSYRVPWYRPTTAC
jgi:hypothetical protein